MAWIVGKLPASHGVRLFLALGLMPVQVPLVYGVIAAVFVYLAVRLVRQGMEE